MSEALSLDEGAFRFLQLTKQIPDAARDISKFCLDFQHPWNLGIPVALPIHVGTTMS